MTAFSEFLAYKTRVPVRGAILLNQEMDEVVLVKGWKKGANWSFPRGKINKGEADLDCAIREVYEETGFDVRQAGLVKNDDDVKHIQITMREQHMRLYIFSGVPRDTYFEPRTRKEISKIEWYKLSELPTLKKSKQYDEGLAVANANKFYMVAPFLHPLKKWIAQQKKLTSKTQAGMASVEGYVSTEENGQRVNGTPDLQSVTELAAPSDLPEVASAHDASSHLKRLLNIGGAVPAQALMQAPVPAPTAASDLFKANALLDLLRNGSQEAVLQVQNQSMPPPNVSRAGVPPAAQPDHLAPNFFPGFPQRQQHTAPSNFMQQTSGHIQNGTVNSNVQPPMNPPQHPTSGGFPPIRQHELSGSPAIPRFPQAPGPNYHNHYPQSPPSNPMRPRQVAPFQRTGDPQFSQSTQPSQVAGATVPPASKLPPPKLTSHSQKLLDVFKGGFSMTPKSPQTTELLTMEKGPQTRTTSQHQDSLLGLFKGPRMVPAPEPVELGGHPMPPAPPAGKQILQRPSQRMDPNLQRGNGVSRARMGQTQTSADVSGPMNMPQSEAMNNFTPDKAASAPNRRIDSGRRERIQSQQLSSPITILPRPQPAKRDTAISGPNVQVNQIQSQYHMPQTEAPEPVKPFQPQILRRSEKPGYENLMTTLTLENVDCKPNLPGLQTNPSELVPQTNYDRRPSQTMAQKETLLSLFGKTPVSPSPTSATQLDSRAVNQQPSRVSSLVSPLSSRHLPSSGDSLSLHGTPLESDMNPPASNHIASPSNKEFLLEYLQGVAKGNR